MAASKKKAWVYLVLSLLWMAVIFAFSNQANSGHITEAYLHGANVPVRKLGHISEFGLLALLYFQVINSFRQAAGKKSTPVRTAVQALLLAFAWASLDEIHQSFVPGRSAAFSDVLIDSSGMVVALLLRHFLTASKNLN